jgi:hypothetical protein
MGTFLELGNDGGAEVTRRCVRDGEISTAQTRPSQGEFYREFIAQ